MSPTDRITSEERYEAFSFADGDELERIADLVLVTAKVRVTGGPEVATAPLRVGVPGTDATAVIGHAALTTCNVVVDGVRGDGCRPGRDLRGALAAAVCDAEAERGGRHAGAIDALVRDVLAARLVAAGARARAVELTRIDGAA